MQEIKGKVVIVTGASSGIGEAIAISLVQKGAKVVLAARRTEEMQTVITRIDANSGEARAIKTDVTSKTDWKRLIQFAVDEFGKLDVIVNNAGVASLSRIDELDVDGWDQMIDVNIKGTLYGMAASIPVFNTQGSGHIINIISPAGIKIVPTQAVYAGTKNAVRTITEAFRQESDGRIRITGISPGYIHTDFASKSVKTGQMKEAAQKKVTQIAIGPEAVADAVIYAISQPADVEIGDIVIRPAVQD